jgi:1-acyl-sn-glycerol-3-phosphate acyltransferase
MGLILWPLIILLPGRQLRHRVVQFVARAFLRLTGITLDVEAQSAIPERGVIIVANHASYLDGLILCAAVQGELTFVAKQDLGRQLVAGPFLKRLGTIFVRRIDPVGGREDTDAIVSAAQAKARLVILPEGTFSRMPGLLPFRLGAFLTAAQTGIGVVPVAIAGTRMILRANQWFPRRGRISVKIGNPLFPDGTDFAAAVRLRDRCRAAILERLGEPDLSRERIELPPD